MTVMKLDETSPLLPNQPVEDPGAIRVKVTPLPKLQLGGELRALSTISIIYEPMQS